MKGTISAAIKWLSNAIFSPRIPIKLKRITHEDDGTTTVVRYSPYFLLDHLDEPSNVLCRVTVTFGDERLPEPEKSDYKHTARNLFKNAHHVYSVTEIYFANYSDQTKTITLDSFASDKRACDESWLQSLPPKTVEARSLEVLKIFIDHVFYLKDEFEIELKATIDGRQISVQGLATRQTSTYTY